MIMIKKEVLKKINEQITLEYEAAFIYKRMSIQLAEMGWTGFAHWMHAQYREEIEHAEEMIDYVLSRGESPVLHDVKMKDFEAKSVLDYFQISYEHECFVSESINKIVALAIEQSDFASENFFRKFVDEQVEEEETVSGILDKMKMIKNEGALFIMDAQLGKR